MSAATHAGDARPVTQTQPKPYAQAWQSYWAAGWRGVLPLPPGRKHPPPAGTTGYGGRWPSFADCWTWAEQRPRANIAIRLADGQVGIDVDHYATPQKIKRGWDTITNCTRRAGVELPPTWRLSSRGPDNPSGRYLYRVPPETRLVTALPDVELLQTHHRYAVTWPSTNDVDGGRLVQWIDPGGRIADRIPSPQELPELPAPWVELLRCQTGRTEPLLLDAGAWRGFYAALEPGPACAAVRSRVEAAEAAIHSQGGLSRYDLTRTAVLALLRLGEGGHHGVTDALRRLRESYIAAVTDRADERTARAEFARMCRPQAVGLILATPTPDEQRCCICPDTLRRLVEQIPDPGYRAQVAADLGVPL